MAPKHGKDESVAIAKGQRARRRDELIDQIFGDGKPLPPFTPYVFRSEGGAIRACWDGEADYQRVVNGNIILYVGLETGKIVGCELCVPEENDFSK